MLSLVVLAIPFLSGCDLGTYNARFKERTVLLDEQSELAGLLKTDEYHEILLPDQSPTGVKVLMPAGFVNGQMAVYREAQIRAEPLRAIPPGIRLPGFSSTFERVTPDTEGNTIGYYVYQAIVPKTEMTVDDVKAAIDEQLATVFPDAGARWEPTELLSPTGQYTNWEKLRLISTQDFVEFKPGATDPTFRKLDGHFVLGVHETANYIVIMGFRVPAPLNDQLNFLNTADATMGSIISGTPSA